MQWTVDPADRAEGTVVVPADKSITHRGVMLGALADGTTVVENYLASADCLNTVRAFQAMGVRIEQDARALRITGAGIGGLRPPAGVIDAGNSGTTVRLLSGVLTGCPFTARIAGDESLSRRPMKRIIEPLTRMGARFAAREGNFLPREITGTAAPLPLAYDSPVASAQVKSAILFAGLSARGETSVTEPVRSRDHTERMLAACGAEIAVNGTRVTLKGPARLRPFSLTVPGDISSAAFFLVLGVISRSGRVVLPLVGVNPTRDGILEVLAAMGARVTLSDRRTVSGEQVATLTAEPSALRAANVTAAQMPRLIDEVPIIALAATQAAGVTVISGAGELRVKESDRIRTVAGELSALGASIEELPDGMAVRGPTPLRGARVRSHGDHRIAMMLAVAGSIASGTTLIDDVGCVDTSFPGFLAALRSLR